MSASRKLVVFEAYLQCPSWTCGSRKTEILHPLKRALPSAACHYGSVHEASVHLHSSLMSPEARVMDPEDLSGEDAKPDVIVHKGRVGADPTEGWRRGTRGELRKSCDTCTASKTKCCGGIPCDRCKKRNLTCKFRYV